MMDALLAKFLFRAGGALIGPPKPKNPKTVKDLSRQISSTAEAGFLRSAGENAIELIFRKR